MRFPLKFIYLLLDFALLVTFVKQDLTAIFGADWASIHLMPTIIQIRNNAQYLLRLTAVQACTLMSTAMNPDAATVELLPIILDMASDKVSSIISRKKHDIHL